MSFLARDLNDYRLTPPPPAVVVEVYRAGEVMLTINLRGETPLVLRNAYRASGRGTTAFWKVLDSAGSTTSRRRGIYE